MRSAERPPLQAAPPIESLEWLALLTELRDRFSLRFGFTPDNVSHWNTKSHFGDELERRIAPPLARRSLTDYTYTSDLDGHSDVSVRLGEAPGRSCVFTPSGTTSIANVVAYLKNVGVTSIVGIRPHYFAFSEFAHLCGIKVISFDVVRRNNAYFLPPAARIIESGARAVWLTNPVYGTSVYYSNSDLQQWLDSLSAEGVLVVADESLAHVDRAVAPLAANQALFIGIYVPHKALCLNGFRFSVATFPQALHESLEQWSDLFSGGLSAENIDAIRHFRTSAFPQSAAVARDLQRAIEGRLLKLISNFPFVDLDHGADGHFRHLYFPLLDASWQHDKELLERLIFASGASFIPAARFGHPPSSGFCFRVNLLRLDDSGLGALYRLLHEIGVVARERCRC